MKPAHQRQLQRGNAAADFASIDQKSLPASSMWLGLTMPASPEDIAAVLRTAIIFARNLKTSVVIQLPGETVIQVEADDYLAHGSVESFLETFGSRVRKLVSGKGDLVLEVAINAASFLSPGEISLRIRGLDSGGKRPVVAR